MLACLMLAFSACGAERAFAPVDLPDVYRIPDCVMWEHPTGGEDGRLYVTREQAVADFDCMWAMLLENAPF